jgi:hypothetical protein
MKTKKGARSERPSLLDVVAILQDLPAQRLSDPTNWAHGPVVEQAQKHGLQRDGHVTDLVEEEREI